MKQDCKERSHERSGVFGTFLFFVRVCIFFFCGVEVTLCEHESHLTFIHRSVGHTLYSSSVTQDTVCFRSVTSFNHTRLHCAEKGRSSGRLLCVRLTSLTRIWNDKVSANSVSVSHVSWRSVLMSVRWYLWETLTWELIRPGQSTCANMITSPAQTQ